MIQPSPLIKEKKVADKPNTEETQTINLILNKGVVELTGTPNELLHQIQTLLDEQQIDMQSHGNNEVVAKIIEFPKVGIYTHPSVGQE